MKSTMENATIRMINGKKFELLTVETAKRGDVVKIYFHDSTHPLYVKAEELHQRLKKAQEELVECTKKMMEDNTGVWKRRCGVAKLAINHYRRAFNKRYDIVIDNFAHYTSNLRKTDPEAFAHLQQMAMAYANKLMRDSELYTKNLSDVGCSFEYAECLLKDNV